MPWLANEDGASVTGTKVLLHVVCVGATVVCKSRGMQEKVSTSSRCVPVGRWALMESRCKWVRAIDDRVNGNKELLIITKLETITLGRRKRCR